MLINKLIKLHIDKETTANPLRSKLLEAITSETEVTTIPSKTLKTVSVAEANKKNQSATKATTYSADRWT